MRENINAWNVRAMRLKSLDLNIKSFYKNINAISDFIKMIPLGISINDILLNNFQQPTIVIQLPHRETNKGGWLAIYLDNFLCSRKDIPLMNVGKEPPNPNGELIFIENFKFIFKI